MTQALLLLLFSAAIAFGGDTLEQKLSTRELALRHPPESQTLPQVLAALCADYQTQYHEPLPIFVAVELAQPTTTTQSPPTNHPVPPPATDPDITARTDTGPLHAPVIELLRFCAGLTNSTFTIQGDVILFHAKPK